MTRMTRDQAIEKIAELERQLAAEKQQHKWTIDSRAAERKSAEEASAEIEQMHVILDALPGTIPRVLKNVDTFKETHNNLQTRFVTFIAARKEHF